MIPLPPLHVLAPIFLTGIALLASPTSAQETATNWTVDDTVVLKNGEPFFAKGMNYSPTPVGAATFLPGVGDWFTPPWNGIWERDLPILKAMGVNTIRTYFTWYWMPSDNLATLAGFTQESPLSVDPWGNTVDYNHLPFLDACHAAGVYVVLGIALDGGNTFNYANATIREAYQNFYLQTAEKLAKRYGEHPAVIGFSLSNEQNQPGPANAPTSGRNADPRTWAYYQQLADVVRQHAPNKLITIAFQDDAELYNGSITINGEPLEKVISNLVDVWGLNIYAGMSGDLSRFQQFVINPGFARPLWITEWGVSGGKNVPAGTQGPLEGAATGAEKSVAEQQIAASQITAQIELMQDHLTFVAGGFYFAYSDEWWKNYLDPNTVQPLPTAQNPYANIDPNTGLYIQQDAQGRVTTNVPLPDGSFRKVYPTYVWRQDGSTSPDWPEEFWGLHAIAPNQRPTRSGPYDVANNKPFPADRLTPRQPMVNAVAEGYATLESRALRLTNARLNRNLTASDTPSTLEERLRTTGIGGGSSQNNALFGSANSSASPQANRFFRHFYDDAGDLLPPSRRGALLDGLQIGDLFLMEDFGLVRLLARVDEGFWVNPLSYEDSWLYFDLSAPDFVFEGATGIWYRIKEDRDLFEFDQGRPTGTHGGIPIRLFEGGIWDLQPPDETLFSHPGGIQPFAE